MAELYRLDIRKHRNILEKTEIEKAFSEYRIQKIKACKKQEKKEECTLSGLLLDFVLKQHGMTEKEAVFTENADGKSEFLCLRHALGRHADCTHLTAKPHLTEADGFLVDRAVFETGYQRQHDAQIDGRLIHADASGNVDIGITLGHFPC